MKRYTHRWRVNAVLLVSVMLLTTSGPVVARDNQAEFQTVGWANPCLLYGSVETPRQDARLFAIDLVGNTTQLLGEALPKAHISGLAVHPDTGELVALVVNQTGPKVTTLTSVDVATGAMTPIGETEMDFGAGLSFRPSDATLWAWWREHGLVRIDPETAAAELVLAGDLAVSALAWDPTGAVLYLAGNRSLWKFQDGNDTFELVVKPLPVLVGGLAMRGDGQLLLTAADADQHGLDLLVFDPMTGAVAAKFNAPDIPLETGRRRDKVAAFIEALTWPLACGNPSPGGEADLIQSIQIDNLEVCPGETVHVQVQTIHPEGGGNPVQVWIDGLPGDERTLQLDGPPGPHLINVSASTAEGYADRESLTVEVLDCGPVPLFPRLSVEMNPFHPYTVDLLVANTDEIAPLGAAYEWEFGDGATAITDVPFVSHSYEDALQPDQEYMSFEAAVTVQLPDGTALWAAETVAVWNAYAANRERGLIQPPTTHQPELVLSGSLLTGEYTLRNLEDGPITLTGRQIEHQPCDPALDPVALPWEEISLTLGPGEELVDTLTLDAPAVPEDVCGIALHLAGQAELGQQVAVDLYFQVQRNELLAQPETDAPTLALLNDVAAQGLVPDPDYITDEDLYLLSHQGQIVIPPSTTAAASRAPAQTSMAAAADESDCDDDANTPNPIGCTCERGELPPGDLPENVGSISCQATEDFDRYPPHLPNALKGDIVLVQGCGFVQKMLKVLDQDYTHTGIMTKNYIEIAHSTSTDERLEDHVGGLPPEIDEDILRWGWPGAIREDVATAFTLKTLTDPYGKDYDFADFNAEPMECSPGSIIVPAVVKPPPALAQELVNGGVTVRQKLHQAADFAAQISTRYPDEFIDTGTGHYRFYSYSDATIALEDSYDHPVGEKATVCSTFVWYALRNADASLEGDPEYGEPVTGWDGLYYYPEQVRRSAAQLMWDNVYETMLLSSAPWFWLEDIPTQIVNCFVRDTCYNPAHDYWRNPGEGWTVSPDNILLWDPPTDEDGDGMFEHGLYGYNERLVFRSGGYKRVYLWAPSEGTGTVEGIVTYEGAPVAGATVILNAAGGLETASGPDGSFEFLAVPGGTYEIEAQQQRPDIFLSSRDQTVTVVDGETASVELILLPPSEDFRHVPVSGYVKITDREWGPFCCKLSSSRSFGLSGLACRVDQYTTTSDTEWWERSEGDADVRLKLWCWINPDNSVSVYLFHYFDDDSMGANIRTLAPGVSYSFLGSTYTSADSDCWGDTIYDEMTIRVTVRNLVQNY